MNSENDNKKNMHFSSAMGDLKGLLDKEGINLNSEINPDAIPTSPAHTLDNLSNTINPETPPLSEDIDIPLVSNEVPQPKLPTLNGTITIIDENESNQNQYLDDYISDFDNDGSELADFAVSIQELEEKVESITDPEHLHLFEQSEAGNVQLRHMKANLHKKLSQQIETSIDELKAKLLNSMESEINDLFDHLSQK